MSYYKASVGLRNVGSYQVSGTPWITGSANLDDEKCHMIEFPDVTKSILVVNTNTTNNYDLRVHFQSGSGTTAITVPGDAGAQTISDSSDVIAGFHYMTVPAGYASLRLDVKCKRFYISQNVGSVNNMSYQVFAELTNIPTSSMFVLTGSGITE